MTKAIDSIKTDETLPDLTKADVVAAKKEGALSAIKESAASRFKATDGAAITGDEDPGVQATYDVFHLQDLLELEPDALLKRLQGKDDAPGAVPTYGQAAGLLEVERSGKNRTDVVETLCKHLNIKTPYEVTDAGPGWTNDVSRAVLKR